MNINLNKALFLLSLTMTTPYTSAAAAATLPETPRVGSASSHVDPQTQSVGWWQAIGSATTRATATLMKSPLGSLIGYKTPDRAHTFLSTIRIEEKTGDDGIKRNKAERYLNNATAELTENTITSLQAMIKQLSTQRDFLTQLLTLQPRNPLSQTNADRLSTINRSLIELESIVAKFKDTAPMTPTAMDTDQLLREDSSKRHLYLTEEQIRAHIEEVKPQTTWTPEETAQFHEKLNAYHASFATILDLRKTLQRETELQRQTLFRQLQARRPEEKASAPEPEELQKLKRHDYSSYPGLAAINQKIKGLQKQQLAVRLEPWLLIEYTVDKRLNLVPGETEQTAA